MSDKVRYTVPKPEHGSQDWLNLRWANEQGEKRITASVAGAIHGQHQFVSVADLAAELLAPAPPEPSEGNADTERGTGMEPWIAQVTETNLDIKLYEPTVMYAYEEPGVRLMATVDRLSQPSGQTVFEIKSWRGYFDGVLKPEWYWQGIQLAICCDVPSIEWAILDSSLTVHHHTQHVSSDEKQIHIDACRRFLEAIDCGMFPDEAVLSYGHVLAQNPAGEEGKIVELPVEMLDVLERLSLAKAQIKEGETVEELCKAEIGAVMGDAEIGTYGGHTLCTWKTSTRTSFNQKRFTAEHPALAEKYRETKPVRTFRTTKGDDK